MKFKYGLVLDVEKEEGSDEAIGYEKEEGRVTYPDPFDSEGDVK